MITGNQGVSGNSNESALMESSDAASPINALDMESLDAEADKDLHAPSPCIRNNRVGNAVRVPVSERMVIEDSDEDLDDDEPEVGNAEIIPTDSSSEDTETRMQAQAIAYSNGRNDISHEAGAGGRIDEFD